MLLSFAAALAVAATPIMQASCIDPATPLRELALAYADWPQPQGERSTEAFAALQQFLRSGADGDYRSAVREYEALADRLRGDVHVQLALGILYATGSDLNPPDAAGYRHRLMYRDANADDRGARALEFVAERAPAVWLAPVAFTHVAVATREKRRVGQAVEILGRALAADPANATLQLAWSDLLMARGMASEALAFWSARNAGCPAAMHAKAEALLQTGDTAAGARLYVGALAAAGPSDVHRFHDDARVIMVGDEAVRYDALSPQLRAGWLRLFWERSAALSGISVESRIVQHMRRVAHAHALYRRATTRPANLIAATERIDLDDPSLSDEERRDLYEQDIARRSIPVTPVLGPMPWDDRGVIYVRQGEPDTTFQTKAGSGTRIPRNETWVYARGTPPWVLSFARPGDLGPDYYWTYSIGCGLTGSLATLGRTGFGSRGRATLGRSGSAGGHLEARDFYLDLAQFDPRFDGMARYCGLASVGGGSAAEWQRSMQDLAQYYRPLMRTITGTESAPPRFRRALRMIIAAYSFLGEDGIPEVTALTWIPTPELNDSTPTDRLRLTYTLVDRSSAPLRHDTIVSVPRIDEAGLLRSATTWRDVRLRGGRLLVIAMDDANPTQGVQRTQQVTIPFDRTLPAISDVVVGEPDAAGLLVRGAYRISPLPSHAITPDSDFRLFYELYGIPAGTMLETTIRVVRTEQKSVAELLRLFPGRREERELSFSGPAEIDGRGFVVQDVAVGGNLLPGEYSIEVIVTTPTGELKRTGPLLVDR